MWTAASVTLAAGDDVTCTFVNVIERGAVLIHKTAKHAAALGGQKNHEGVTFTVANANNGTNHSRCHRRSGSRLRCQRPRVGPRRRLHDHRNASGWLSQR